MLHRHIDYDYDQLDWLTCANYTDQVSWGKWNTFNYQYSYNLDSNRTMEAGTYFPTSTTPFVNST